MPRAKKVESQPWLRYIVLPFLLILFGLETSYVYLSRTKLPPLPNLEAPITAVLTPTPTPPNSVFCGGIAAYPCPQGAKCVLTDNHPDASGICVGNIACPKTNWVNCLPSPGSMRAECTPGYLRWAKTSCPGFQGAAY